jgi:hypothetical protein
VYVCSPYVQRGNGIGSFFANQFRAVKPLALRGAKALGCEAFNTGAQSLSDVGSKQLDAKFKYIVAGRLAESAQRLIAKL